MDAACCYARVTYFEQRFTLRTDTHGDLTIDQELVHTTNIVELRGPLAWATSESIQRQFCMNPTQYCVRCRATPTREINCLIHVDDLQNAEYSYSSFGHPKAGAHHIMLTIERVPSALCHYCGERYFQDHLAHNDDGQYLCIQCNEVVHGPF